MIIFCFSYLFEIISKFKIVLTIQYISFLKSFWDRFQSKMYLNEKHFAYNVIIISIDFYDYHLVYIVSITYRDHFRTPSTTPKVGRVYPFVCRPAAPFFEPINFLTYSLERLFIGSNKGAPDGHTKESVYKTSSRPEMKCN